MNKTIIHFTRESTLRRFDSLTITESYNRKRKWWNFGIGSSYRFSFGNIFYPPNSYHRDKFPHLVQYLEKKTFNLSVYSRNYSYLRFLLKKEYPLKGTINLGSRFIGIDVFQNSFTLIQLGQNHNNKIEIRLQFDTNVLEEIERKFMNGIYPLEDNNSKNDEFLLNSNFVVLQFWK